MLRNCFFVCCRSLGRPKKSSKIIENQFKVRQVRIEAHTQSMNCVRVCSFARVHERSSKSFEPLHTALLDEMRIIQRCPFTHTHTLKAWTLLLSALKLFYNNNNFTITVDFPLAGKENETILYFPLSSLLSLRFSHWMKQHCPKQGSTTATHKKILLNL